MSTQPSRPIGVTILGILALIAGLINAFHALQYMGLFPIMIGSVRFFGINLLGSLGFIILAAIWFWVFRMLWQLNPQGWSFMTFLALINIVFAVIAVIGSSTLGEELAAIIINAVILIYAYSSGVKKSFGLPA
jgi:hypothetical protein